MDHGPWTSTHFKHANLQLLSIYIIKYFKDKKLTISENFLAPLCHGAEKFQGGQITIQGGQLPHLPPLPKWRLCLRE